MCILKTFVKRVLKVYQRHLIIQLFTIIEFDSGNTSTLTPMKILRYYIRENFSLSVSKNLYHKPFCGIKAIFLFAKLSIKKKSLKPLSNPF